MRKVNTRTITKTRRTSTSVIDAISAIRKRVDRKKKKWDSVKLVRAIRDGR